MNVVSMRKTYYLYLFMNLSHNYGIFPSSKKQFENAKA